jgi:2-oxoisovalerate dehydrogenase E2 component (dihydrolipoyl transacylase)
MKCFRLPQLGEGLQEAEIVCWHVAAGDQISVDQPLVSVETEKAVVEVLAPWAGTIHRVYVSPGEIVMTGVPLAEIEMVQGVVEPMGGSLGLTSVNASQRPRMGGVRAAATWLEARTETLAARPAGRQSTATPAVRARADALGIDLAQIRGGGPGGAVALEDVEEAGRAILAPHRYKPLTGVRRAMAQTVSRARDVTPCSVSDEAIVGSWPEDADVTVRLVRALIAGCRAAPMLNSWSDPARLSYAQHERVDVGLAMNSANGLFVPVLRDAAGRTDHELRKTIEVFKRDIALRALPPVEMRGPTITLSNFGAFGGRHAELIVLPPQVATVGAGRIFEGVRPVDGKPGVIRVLPVSLSFDHRLVTGFEAVTFLNAMVKALES